MNQRDVLIQPIDVDGWRCGFVMCDQPAAGAYRVSTLDCTPEHPERILIVCREHGDALSKTGAWATLPAVKRG